MMHDFLTAHRDEIIMRTRAKIARRGGPRPTEAELEDGIPLFLQQLIQTLQSPCESMNNAMVETATIHGRNLLRMGFTVGQVVHDYGGLCQAITELAVSLGSSISTDEFHTLNRCLDDAIADAVTEYVRQREQSASDQAVERLGFLAHELRNALHAAQLAFAVLKTGSTGPGGKTNAIIDRSFSRMRHLVDRSLADVRLEAGLLKRGRVLVAGLVEEVSIVAAIEAHNRDVQLTVGPVEYGVTIDADAQTLGAALANLLQNAVKFTRPRSHVSLQTHTTADRVRIKIADECGGLPPGKSDDLFRAFEQRGVDRSGLGLGLAISRQCVEGNGGEIQVHNIPGSGCIFTVDLPRRLGPT
jgi:signal transduction histidine kinase